MIIYLQMCKVYKVIRASEGDNRYHTDRSENWYYELHRTFDTLDEAEDYVQAENLKKLPLADWEAVIRGHRKITDECLCIHWRYTIGKPDWKMMAHYLQQDGVKTIFN